MPIAHQTLKTQVLNIAFCQQDQADDGTLHQLANYLSLSRYIPEQGRIPPQLHAEAGYLISRFSAVDQARLLALVSAKSERQDAH